MKRKPFIALMPLYDSAKNSYWMLPGYMKGIENAGGIPVMLPLTEDTDEISEICNKFDAFLFTGGQDVSPYIYGQKPAKQCGECCISRDVMEKQILKTVLETDKPVLGICRGIQFFNAVLGGTLYQDLKSEHPSPVTHCQKTPYDKPVHSVKIIKGTPLFDILQTENLLVNSYHHQAIKTLSPHLSAAAYSEDNLIEGVYIKNKSFALAVQWHPEFMYKTDKFAQKIFEAFVRSAAANIA